MIPNPLLVLEEVEARRHPARRSPIETAQDFHDEMDAFDQQTGRVLPRRVLPMPCTSKPAATAARKWRSVAADVLMLLAAAVLFYIAGALTTSALSGGAA